MNREEIIAMALRVAGGGKDRDIMRDTGGAIKNRKRMPNQKPPRDDLRVRFRKREKTPGERDPDVDNDPDLKKSSRRGTMDENYYVAAAGNVSDSDQGWVDLNAAVDAIIMAIQSADKALAAIKPDTDKQKSIVDKVRDLFDTAVAPYTADIAKALDELETEGE